MLARSLQRAHSRYADYAFVRASDDDAPTRGNRWFKCNDAVVTRCEWNDVVAASTGGASAAQGAAYCLIYVDNQYRAASTALSDDDIAAHYDEAFLASLVRFLFLFSSFFKLPLRTATN